jgi:D-alanyl-D-alanine carboxypeptidase/D-alanyl-D-alanine-endopeptidase (penicillin-binding protein 4)
MNRNLYQRTAIGFLAAMAAAVIFSGAGIAAGLTDAIGPRDALMIIDPAGAVVAAKNVDTMLIPASTLKIFTALAAFHYLGADYRFATKFFQDAKGNLKVRGTGDPMLTSEVLAEMAKQIAAKRHRFKDLIVDASYFTTPLPVPGTTDTFDAYDAPIGAFCANFNTVSFQRVKGVFVSAEPQTPLLKMALSRINASKMSRGRIVLSDRNQEHIRYAGNLLRTFLVRQGVVITGKVRIGRVYPAADQLILRFESPFHLTRVVTEMLYYSNNFMANQLFVAMGASVYGPPGTIEKGLRAERRYRDQLGIKALTLAEGSGISRENTVSARAMQQVLAAFAPHYRLMRFRDGLFYKTGTLNGVAARAGYMESAKGLYRFVLLINTPGKAVGPVFERVRRRMETAGHR